LQSVNANQRYGLALTGLNTRLKSYESLVRKIYDKGLHHHYQDVLRYTLLTDAKDYAEKANLVMEDMENLGYKRTKLNNYWLKAKMAYNGVNTNFATPEGYIFELQFHTPESLELKNKLHPIYEKLRIAQTKAEAKRYDRIMLEIAKDYIIPPNVRNIR
jgi:hypothetical protein